MRVSEPASAEPIRLQRATGAGRIAARRDPDGVSRLDTLYQQGCCKLRVPKSHGPALSGVLINASGGLTDGDRLAWGASVAEGAHLVVTTQACERIYRSLGAPAEITSTLHVAEQSRIDWLPQETILFDGARLERTLDVEVGEGGTFLGLEAVILGRAAMGETALNAALGESWRIRHCGRLIHAEAGRLAANDPVARDNPGLLDKAGAFATMVYVGDDAERRHARVASRFAGTAGFGMSVLGRKLVIRALAPSGYALRKIITPVIAALAMEATVPRLWTL